MRLVRTSEYQNILSGFEVVNQSSVLKPDTKKSSIQMNPDLGVRWSELVKGVS